MGPKFELEELIVMLGIMDKADLERYVSVARFMGLPLSKILEEDGRLSGSQLKVLLRLKVLLQQELISIEVARIAMLDLEKSGCSAEELLVLLDSLSESTLSKFDLFSGEFHTKQNFSG